MSAGGFFRDFCLILSLVFFCEIGAGGAATEGEGSIHWSAAKSVWDRRARKVSLRGNASVQEKNETLTADEIDLDLETRALHARGHVLYVMGDTVIYGEELRINLRDRTGFVRMGKVASPLFSVSARKLTKVSDKRYLAEEGTYTTCVDCPQSWTLLGEDLDLEFDGYAFMSNVRAAVKDLPLLWLPYMVIPMKTERQSGVLMPKFGYSNNGMMFVLPYYWAMSRSADMTFGVGSFSRLGPRLEWEGRYALSPRSFASANFYYIRDREFDDLLLSRGIQGSESRWAISINQQQELPWGIEQKLQLVNVSDALYPRRIRDVQGFGEGALSSTLSFSRVSSDMSAQLTFRRYRNLIGQDPDPRVFDENLVQAFPSAQVTTNDWLLFGGRLGAGLTLGLNHFTREGADYDRDLLINRGPDTDDIRFRPGIDAIRKATRLTALPVLFTSFHPGDFMTIRPSIEFNNYLYSFPASVSDQDTPLDTFYRGYLLGQVEATSEFERVFKPSVPSAPTYKHTIRPRLLYSWIPLSHESDQNHPFVRQMQFATDNSFSGYNFDSQDIVPLGENRNYNNYFLPLGNSLAFGLHSQLIEKSGLSSTGDVPNYRRLFEVRALQSLNLREYEQAELENRDAEPFSRLSLGALADLGFMSAAVDYYYLPYAPSSELESRHQFSAHLNYVLERSMRQRVLAFERSFRMGFAFNKASGAQTHNLQLGGAFSLSDYILPTGSISYDFVSERFIRMDGSLSFQSPSRCYKVELKVARFVCDRQSASDTGVCGDYRFEFAWNITGKGFSGLDQMVTGPR